MIPCGGQCGDSACKKEFKDDQALKGHIYGMRARRGKAASGSPAPAAKPGERPYSFIDTTKSPSPQGGAGSPPPTAPPQPGPVFMDTTWLWLGLGEMVDTLLELKGIEGRLKMTEVKARALDASIKAFPFAVQPPAKPIPMPWYAPFLITVSGTVVIPLALILIPEVIKRFQERREKAAEKERGRVEPGAAQQFARAVTESRPTVPEPGKPTFILPEDFDPLAGMPTPQYGPGMPPMPFIEPKPKREE